MTGLGLTESGVKSKALARALPPELPGSFIYLFFRCLLSVQWAGRGAPSPSSGGPRCHSPTLGWSPHTHSLISTAGCTRGPLCAAVPSPALHPAGWTHCGLPGPSAPFLLLARLSSLCSGSASLCWARRPSVPDAGVVTGALHLVLTFHWSLSFGVWCPVLRICCFIDFCLSFGCCPWSLCLVINGHKRSCRSRHLKKISRALAGVA